jgi:hypothetical protein
VPDPDAKCVHAFQCVVLSPTEYVLFDGVLLSSGDEVETSSGKFFATQISDVVILFS